MSSISLYLKKRKRNLSDKAGKPDRQKVSWKDGNHILEVIWMVRQWHRQFFGGASRLWAPTTDRQEIERHQICQSVIRLVWLYNDIIKSTAHTRCVWWVTCLSKKCVYVFVESNTVLVSVSPASLLFLIFWLDMCVGSPTTSLHCFKLSCLLFLQ